MKMVVVKKGEEEFYVDAWLAKSLDQVHDRVHEKDEDYFFAVDGEEGSGKSVFTMQLAKYVDPGFCLDRVCFTAQEFEQTILKAKKGEAIVFDEAFRGLSSRGALTEVNKLLIALMMECRQKNLFVFVVMPTMFLLDKYVALWRAKGLFHVYRQKHKRGFWSFYNKKNKKLLYLKGKTNYSYSAPKVKRTGRFTNKYVIDEDEYRKKKRAAFRETGRETRADNYLTQRNLLLWIMNRMKGVTTVEISRLCKEKGVKLAQNTISEAIKPLDKKYLL